MSQTYFAILTAVGEAKLANATALGSPLQISRMAVGDGNGNLPVPNRLQTALVNETYRADLNALQVDPVNASQVIAELIIPEAEGGYWLREMGLYDAAGDLIAVSNCPPSYKPQLAEGSGRTQVLRMVLIVSSTAAVQLKIDPSVVLATREFVTTTVAAELAKLDAKNSVKAATTANLAALSGLLTVDGVALAVGDRVLVKNQAAGATNGIYVAAAGAWSRAADADASIEVTPGMLVPVEQGAINGDSLWQLATDAPISLGTTALVFEIAAGPTGLAAGTYRSITVDKRGRVIGGTNPTTRAGYGITDAIGPGEFGIGGNRSPAISDLTQLILIGSYRVNMDTAVGVPVKLGSWANLDVGATDSLGWSFELHNPYVGRKWLGGRNGQTGEITWREVLHTGNVDRNALCPPGMVSSYAMTTPPAGWLKANGAAVSRTTYAALFAAIGTTFGAGDGSTTFTLPDLRGEFVRGWDDARGVDAGRVFGTAQAGTIVYGDDAATPSIYGFKDLRTGANADSGQGLSARMLQLSTAAGSPLNETTAIGDVYLGVARPRNIALLACIKF